MARKALCVGINKFKNYPQFTLQGCVNDANDMKGVLKDLLGFTNADITVLTDAQATKANIWAKLKALVDEAKKGKLDYIVFSLSSHGTQVPDLSGDEPDQADEAFVPYDIAQKGNGWDPKYVITDDEFHDLFVQLPPNVLLEVYFDTCHSGSGLKAIDLLTDRRPRYIPPPSMKAFKEVEGKRSRGLRHLLAPQRELVHNILWAGCRSDQTSADAHISGAYHGAFTYYFVKEIRACKNKLARKDLLAKIRANLAAGHYSQIPQLECEATVRNKAIK
jgi:metacaspase-1